MLPPHGNIWPNANRVRLGKPTACAQVHGRQMLIARHGATEREGERTQRGMTTRNQVITCRTAHVGTADNRHTRCNLRVAQRPRITRGWHVAETGADTCTDTDTTTYTDLIPAHSLAIHRTTRGKHDVNKYGWGTQVVFSHSPRSSVEVGPASWDNCRAGRAEGWRL